jgi:GR25 family glycosyltransferase involved in LPS biosynthesis
MARSQPVFHAFEHAYVINLDEDTDRMRRVSSRLARLGVPFERFSALHPSREVKFRNPRIRAGAYACAESHAALLRLIRERGHSSALILEDDVVFRDDGATLMESISAELAGKPWDIFYMGLHLLRSGGRLTKHLGRVSRGFHSHAYAVSWNAIPKVSSYIESVLSNPVETFDYFDDEEMTKLYAIPILAIQEPNYSYTIGRHVDRLAQYFTVFDGNDFESHCDEMQNWESNWRKLLAFNRAVVSAEKVLKSGPLEEAASRYINAITEWPELEATLSLQSEFLEVRKSLDSSCTTDEELLKACTCMSSLIHKLSGMEL